MEMSCTISLSLALASLTFSHVTAMVVSVETAEDINWASMALEHDAEAGSVQRMPARNEFSKMVCREDTESLGDATSSHDLPNV